MEAEAGARFALMHEALSRDEVMIGLSPHERAVDEEEDRGCRAHEVTGEVAIERMVLEPARIDHGVGCSVSTHPTHGRLGLCGRGGRPRFHAALPDNRLRSCSRALR